MIGKHVLRFLRAHAGGLRDRAGFAFFLFAALISILAACQHPSLLAWLYASHNGLLAYFYARRRPARAYDRTGLWLGMLAAWLPTWTIPTRDVGYLLLPALAGYSLILWSLITLGRRFGIAPADRGLIRRGPYAFLRHPMYLGELVFRSAMVFGSPQILPAILLVVALLVIQCWRILREEKMIAGYAGYMQSVPWRLIPGLW